MNSDITDAKWLSISDNEEIVWWGHPSFIPLIPVIFFSVVTIAFGIIGTVLWHDQFELLPLLLVPVGVLGLIMEYLHVSTTFYVVTDDKVVYKWGIISRDWIDIRYENIEHAHVNQDVIERVFDFGDINLSTAGTDGVDSKLDNVPNPGEVAKKINQLKDDAYEK